MATKKKVAKKTTKTKKAETFTKEQTLRLLDEKGFNEMVGYARHILDRDGLRPAVNALNSVINLAETTNTGFGYATDVFAAAHSHWKLWNRENPNG